MFRRLTSSILCLSVLAFTTALAQENKFTERVLKNRYQLNFQNGGMSGTGLPVLQNALTGAQFVLIGEDHGISQIPQFTGAVCDMIGPQGFHTMAIETGPLAANELQQWIGGDSGRTNLIAFEKKFPETIAFYDFEEEYDLLTHCARTAHGARFRLWGLDQELMGSSGLILTRILATHPGQQATDEVHRLLQKNDAAHTSAIKSSDPGDIFMMTTSDNELNQLRDLLRKEGSPASQALIGALIKSRDIYQKNMNGSGYESNRERALLMKSNFTDDYKRARQADAVPPKVLLKTGAWHMYKGINPLRNNDMGNFVTELADGQGTTSLHIMICGVKGSQLRFAGIGRPFQPAEFNLAEDKDSDFLFLKPMFDNLESEGWTMFDLRGLRKEFRSLEPVDKEMERMIFGYDLLVLIPNATPSKQIQ
jgi:hypothetical protein